MMRVLIADDAAWLRSALRLLLEEEFNWETVGEASETMALLSAFQYLAPDAVLLDWALPGLHSQAARRSLIAALRAMCPCVYLVMLCGHREESSPVPLSGIDAWISKADPPEQLLATLATLWPTS